MAARKYVLFHINKEVFGMDIARVQGIEKYVDVVAIPNTPDFIRGLINLRGDVIPVFSLRAKFGLLVAEATEETKLIVAKAHDMLVAFEVDSVKEIMEFTQDAMHEPPEIVKMEQTDYLEFVAASQEGLVLLLNLEGILSEAERESLKKIIKEEPAAGN